MDIFCHLPTWKKQREEDRRENLSLGFVPTMGALHRGHLSLVEKSQEDNDRTLVSLFINPTQFDNEGDLDAYPNLVEQDMDLLKEAGVQYVLLPDYDMIYPDKYRYQITETEESRLLCGAHRPGHFNGVLTVVMKLLNIAQADRAYFGEKDYQQYRLVQGMVEAFFMDTEVIPCSLIREEDGLAMSSRNLRLSKEQRQTAGKFNQILSTAESLSSAKEMLKKAGFTVDYVEELWGRRLAAVSLGEVRLIDNVTRS